MEQRTMKEQIRGAKMRSSLVENRGTKNNFVRGAKMGICFQVCQNRCHCCVRDYESVGDGENMDPTEGQNARRGP